MNVFLLYLLLGITIFYGCESGDQKLAVLKHTIQNRLVSAPPEAEVSVAFKNLQTQSTMFLNAGVQMHAASTYKTTVMIEVFKQADEGKFSLTDSLEVKNSFVSIVDKSLYSMDISVDSDESIYDLIGKKSSIYDLTFQMITVSSNLATNILIELVGTENIMKTLSGLNVNKMQVLSGVEDIKAYELGMNNSTNAEDMLKVMAAIASDEAVSPEASAQMRSILLEQKHNSKIPAKLPPEIKVAHKAGSITRISHDAAIIYPPKGPVYALVVLTRGIDDQSDSNELIADISKIVYDEIAKK